MNTALLPTIALPENFTIEDVKAAYVRQLASVELVGVAAAFCAGARGPMVQLVASGIGISPALARKEGDIYFMPEGIVEDALAILDALEDEELSDPLSHWLSGLGVTDPSNGKADGMREVFLSIEPQVLLSNVHAGSDEYLALIVGWDGDAIPSFNHCPLLARALAEIGA